MGEGYTELFFLDEATAMASGHRPCFECRRADALTFSTLWAELRGRSVRAKVAEMDQQLHVERLSASERLDYRDVPVGSVLRQDGAFYLRGNEGAFQWSFEGYSEPKSLSGQVEAMTPKSIRDVLAAGYRPQLHPSALSGR